MMKTSRYTLIKLIAVLAALAISNTACNLASFMTSLCSAPALIVTKTADTNDGLCSQTDCSLREAVITANSCAGIQTIQIPAGTYALTRTGADEEAADRGDLDITDGIVIQGEGDSIIDGDAADRIFDIKPGQTVSISGLVLQNGQTPLFGSAIANQGNLTVNHVVLQNNRQTDRNGNGGTIFTYDLGSSLDISNSAVVNNSAATNAAGLYNVAGTMTVENVTISGNQGYGVINLQGGQTQIKFSTIADNVGTYEIWNAGIGRAVEISNSIIAGNTTEGNCFQPITSGGHNIDSAVGGTANTCGLDGSNDLINTNPQLFPLADNGGNTLTRALGPSSPAINSADSNACSGTDQRNVTRPQGEQCDRGAFELQNPPAAKATPTSKPANTRPPENTPIPDTGSNNGSSGLSLTFNTNANCRKGPGTGYIMVTPFAQGTTVAVIGRNPEQTWALVKIPASGQTCWAAISLGDLNGSLSAVSVSLVPDIPNTPASFTDSTNCSGQHKVTLSWAIVPNATGYNIYRKGKLVTTIGTLTSSYEDAPPSKNGYTYEIEAFNDYGISARVATTSGACH
jgi:CSLREA domain-containing protein